ncbi:enoyl-CoA hydratase-related protein [Jatrophihabitans sp. YIM 134969]
MTDNGVRYEVDGARATITLDRQETRNALGTDGLTALGDAFDAAVADAEVRVVVLTHAGPVFSSGADLRAATGAAPGDQPVARFPAMLQRIWACPKPVIAAADGKTRAGGVGLFAVCDLTVASPTSDFATSEVRLGVVPYVISIPFLARVPHGAARQWFLTGSVFDGVRAHRDGLVDVLADDVPGAVAALVDDIALGGPDAIAATKQLLRGSLDAETLAARYAELADRSARTFASDEAQEGIAAMRGKRPAAWTHQGGTA